VCGYYRGRTVIDMQAKTGRTLARKQAKLRARGENAAAAAGKGKDESKDSK
jgi:hypothetical protein